MGEKFTEMSDELHRYAVAHSHGDELLARARRGDRAELGGRLR